MGGFLALSDAKIRTLKTKNIMKQLFTLLLSYSIFMVNGQLQVPVEKNYVAYLFSYFTGNDISEEQAHYAISNDGYNYSALNSNKPVIDAKDISSTGGVRDPSD